MPKISVIMPVYNAKEEYLREAIDSILSQTYNDFEFIIVNDGSTNNSEEVILSFKDKRIKYVKKENGGVASALNRGLDEANGEYIARMDSDDISLPERFEKQINFLEKHPDISILGTAFEIFGKENFTISHIENPKILDFYQGCFVGHPTVMFRKFDFNKYDLKYNPDYKCEDYELWSRAVKSLKIYNLPEVLFRYRSHTNNISFSSAEFLKDEKRVQSRILNFLTDNEDLKEYIKRYYEVKPEKETIIKKIFSIRNTYIRGRKNKLITILGLKIPLKKSEASVLIMGGLGNQMFQWAFGYAMSQKTKKNVVFDTSWFDRVKDNDFKGEKRVLELQNFKMNLQIGSLENAVETRERCENIYEPSLFKKRGTRKYIGYYQCEKYFKKYRKEILGHFTLRKDLDEKNIKMLEKIKSVNSIAVHIRRGDYLKLYNVYSRCSLDYYNKAIDYIAKHVENPHFFLFSDDVNWVKKFLKISYPYTIVDINSSGDAVFDLELMRNCKHNIIANSTFSWWGAWLNENPEKIVVAPKEWFVKEKTDILPKEWIKIDNGVINGI